MPGFWIVEHQLVTIYAILLFKHTYYRSRSPFLSFSMSLVKVTIFVKMSKFAHLNRDTLTLKGLASFQPAQMHSDYTVCVSVTIFHPAGLKVLIWPHRNMYLVKEQSIVLNCRLLLWCKPYTNN